jgi:hypothetical protein
MLAPGGPSLYPKAAACASVYLDSHANRVVVIGFAATAIGGAEIDLVKAVEHVELGQRDTVDAAGLDRLPHCHRVKPAAAPLASGDDAEFAAALAELLADRVVELGRKRAAADARRVGLGDTEHVADRGGCDPRPGRSLSRDRIRRGDNGVGAVIDIEHRLLRPLEQNPLAAVAGIIEQAPDGPA